MKTRRAWHRHPIAAGALVALGLAAVLSTPSGARISASGIHIPSVANFCDGTEIVIVATICNDTNVSQQYDILFANLGPFAGCSRAVVPAHEFLDPVPVFVVAGDCEEVRIRIQRPVELDSFPDVCYWLHVRPRVAGTSATLGGRLVSRADACVTWALAPSVVRVEPDQPVALDPEVRNDTFEGILVGYVIRAVDGTQNSDGSVFELNGQAPGTTVEGSVEIEPGGSASIPLTVRATGPVAHDVFYDVLSDFTVTPLTPRGQGVGALLASIGLSGTVPPVAVGDAIGGGVAARLRAAPNPTRSGVAVSFELPADAPVVALDVLDVSGRRVRSLLDEARLVQGPNVVVWDGRREDGRAVAPGSYFVRLASASGARAVKVVIAP